MPKVLHLISGGDVGGAKTLVLSLVHELQKHMDVKMICFMEGHFYEDAKAMGINIQVLKQKQRFNLSVVNDIVDIVKREGYDIIHSHGARANFITRFVRRKVRIPCITTIHSDFMLDFKHSLYKHLIYTNLNVFALKNFDYYIAVSEEFKKMLVGRKFNENKIFTVYNGIDFEKPEEIEDKEHFLRENGLSELKDRTLIGIAARLHPVKDHATLIKAAFEVLQQNPDVHFLIAGDGSEKASLVDLIAQLGISKNIHFMGFVEKPYDFFNCIDINVLTSISESFPCVLLEGAKLRKATVASAVGGIPMLIQEGETGYLFKAGDSAELASKLLRLVENQALRQELGSKLYQHAKENYSLEKLTEEHLKIYSRML